MKKLLLLFALVQLYACGSSKNETEAKYSTELKELKKITLPIDERTYFLSKSIFQFEEDGKEYLHFENSQKGMYEIVTFDLEKQVLASRISLNKEGPNGLPALNGSRPMVDNPQLFILSQNDIGKLTLIDNKGNLLKNYDTRTPSGHFNALSLNSHFYSPSFVKDSILYLGQHIQKPNMRRDEWKELPMFFSIDLRNGKYESSQIPHPSIFQNDCRNILGGHRFCYDYNYTNERLVCSFILYDSIMVSDDLKNVKWYYAKSRYLKQMTPRLISADGDMKSLTEYAEMPKYSHILYDKYRDIYYRFALMPYQLKANETPYNTLGAEEFSVIILDKDFRIIGETKFPGNKYFYKMSFVGRDGLYISENNLANPDFDEDKLVFVCFKLEDLKDKE